MIRRRTAMRSDPAPTRVRILDDGVATLIQQADAAGLPGPGVDYLLTPTRRRFALVWLEWKLAVEIDGEGATELAADAEAMCLGWAILRVTSEHIHDGRAIHWIEEILAAREHV